jgi:uncharacterized protein YgfB (UPF0149 family)
MNFIIFGIENPEVRALGELKELERRTEGFEQFISDVIYNEEMDVLAEEIEYDLEETLDRTEELKDLLNELGSKALTDQLEEVESWIKQVLKDLNKVCIFDLENESNQEDLKEVLIAAFELNRYFLLIEEAIRQQLNEQGII